MERDDIGQPPGLRLVGHRVDLELERLAGALPSLHRVADVRRLVVRDRHPLGIEPRKDGGHDIRMRHATPLVLRRRHTGFDALESSVFAAGIVTAQGFLVEDSHWTYAEALALMTGIAAVVIAVLINLGPEARHVKMAPEAAN